MRLLHALLVALALLPFTGAGATAPSPWTADLRHSAWTREDGAPSAVYSLAQGSH